MTHLNSKKIQESNVKSENNEAVLSDIIRNYFNKLKILTTQIPIETRRILLPKYMLFNGFKSIIHLDATGRIGFEICRERGSRISMKTRKTGKRIEEEIFGVLGDENMFGFKGHHSEFRGAILTTKAFVDKFGDSIPKGGTTYSFDKSGKIGPFETVKETEVKIIDTSIYWLIRNKRFVKHIHFVWLFGNSEHLKNIDPAIEAENNYYSFLFGRLYEFLTKGYEILPNPEIRRKVAQTYKFDKKS